MDVHGTKLVRTLFTNATGVTRVWLNERVQRTRVLNRFVLRIGHRRVADARYAPLVTACPTTPLGVLA